MRLLKYIKEEFGPDVIYLEIPEFRQTYTYDCGANAMQTVVNYYGIDYREEAIMKILNTTEENGTPIKNMIAGAKFYGIEVEAKENLKIIDLKNAIDNKWPIIIVLQAYGDSSEDPDWTIKNDNGHYVTVIGYDDFKIYFEDPSSTKRTFLSYKELLERWHDVGAGYGDNENGAGGPEEKLWTRWGMICKGTPLFKTNDLEHLE